MSIYSIIEDREILSCRQRQYIKLRFGLETSAMTRKALAELFGISVARCVTIERRALRRLKSYIEAERGLRDELAAQFRTVLSPLLSKEVA